MEDYFIIAEIRDTYSSDGSVIIKSFSDFFERFFKLESVFIDFFGKIKELEIEFSKAINNLLVIKFKRFNSEEVVQFLIGKKLYVNKDNLFILPKDMYYIHDLVDSEVYLDSLFFGKLIEVMTLPNNDVYVIKKENGNEVMIPAVGKFIMKIDQEERKIFLDPECKIFDEDEN